jgi:hypothetical protein
VEQAADRGLEANGQRGGDLFEIRMKINRRTNYGQRQEHTGRADSIYLTYENKPVVFLTYHGFLTIASSSRIISLDI